MMNLLSYIKEFFFPDGGAEMDWCQREIELEEFQMSFWINQSNENDRVLYDLDCDGDGIYEITGNNHFAFSCTFPKNSGKHQIRLRGEILHISVCCTLGIDGVCTVVNGGAGRETGQVEGRHHERQFQIGLVEGS